MQRIIRLTGILAVAAGISAAVPAQAETFRFSFQGDVEFRPSEILADLRTAAETLYFPMRMCGYWDRAADIHLCPQEERRQPCPHMLPADDPDRVEYSATLQRERQAVLEVSFPHANVSVYPG